jgi:integrase/recombinase XerC
MQIAADSDVEAVRLWLAEYAGSPHTLRSYRKEAVRLLLWATRALGQAALEPDARGLPAV